MSVTRYYLKYKDTTIGVILREEETGIRYLPKYEDADTLPVLIGYPPGIFKLDRTKTPWLPIKTKVNDSLSILNWLIRRSFPKDRHDINSVLNSLGLKEYDPWEVIRRTKGKSKTDSFWLAESEGERYKKKTVSHLAKEISDLANMFIF